MSTTYNYGFEVRNEPILRLGSKAIIPWRADEVRPDLRWPIQQAIFQARMDVVEEMARQSLVSVNDPTVDIRVFVTQPAIPAEVTGGKNIRLPEYNTHFSYVVGERIIW